ncbi:MAG TPA: M61 family peptidase [Thermoanaerobaculia bacterium]|jgi:predicted metalloprotease with PDZ domain|nr:M61 family peptidase [Thermoanaerobaculia bacterium]
MNKRYAMWPALCAAILLALNLGAAAAQPITVELDAREAPRHVLHAHLVLPAQPGPLTLLYPKWIPGEHGPTGPLNGVVGLRFRSQGRELEWRRDPLDMFTFHLEVPAGASAVEADLDFLPPPGSGSFTAGPSVTQSLVVISWNNLVLYPQGRPSDQLQYQASVRLPAGWSFATALPVSEGSGEAVRFGSVSLTTLVDSPILAGSHLAKVPLPTGEGPPHEIDMAADSAAALELPPQFAEAYARLAGEAGALFGARHYRHYQWLLTLSDHVEHFGLEHHESSDNRVWEKTLAEEGRRRGLASLLSHEYVHSWNGKYRRPAGLATPDYQQPMIGELLWVYEGLTQHLGLLLAARSGLWTPEYYRERVAQIAARLDHTAGRAWRPLADTAVAAQLLYGSPPEWRAWRRGTDFYDESVLVWLEADAAIRRQTQGRRSLDDFCRRFHGGQSGPPAIRPYTFDEVVSTLGEVAPFDWRGFFRERIEKVEPRAPLGGVEASGWRLVYNETPNQGVKDWEVQNSRHDWTFSLGVLTDNEGKIVDVVPGLPAAQAGLSPGMKLLAVDGRKWAPEGVDTALRAAKAAQGPIELVAEDGESVRAYRVDYHGGERYPHLERESGKPDVLTDILKPLAAR